MTSSARVITENNFINKNNTIENLIYTRHDSVYHVDYPFNSFNPCDAGFNIIVLIVMRKKLDISGHQTDPKF